MDDTFLDDESQRRPINDQVQAALHGVVNHETSLHSHINKNDAITDAQNSYYKPFKTAKEPRERVIPSDLWAIHENIHLKKVLTVLVFLGDEVTDLLDIVEEKVYAPLSMFGSKPVPPLTADGEDEKDQDFKSGEREMILGKFLPVMQEISNFVDRCYALSLNIIQQLGSLFNTKELVYRGLFQRAHVRCIFTRLGELLQLLITIDSIVQSNTTLHGMSIEPYPNPYRYQLSIYMSIYLYVPVLIPLFVICVFLLLLFIQNVGTTTKLLLRLLGQMLRRLMLQKISFLLLND